ncbi:MAG: peroxiredoxin [Gammaproteobacteria bacterium]|nr:peroxiredoxin [Gammaproteobacteria bacterium]
MNPRRIFRFAGTFVLSLFSALSAGAQPALKTGDQAPLFSLPDQDNNVVELATFRGKWVILYFYPKDDTPGCTTEACNFRDDIELIHKMKAVVLGISTDDSTSHKKFAQKYSLPFRLLADTAGDVARQYGSMRSMGPLKFANRHSFIIDPEGNIAAIFRTVSPKTHSADVRQTLARLQHVAGK